MGGLLQVWGESPGEDQFEGMSVSCESKGTALSPVYNISIAHPAKIMHSYTAVAFTKKSLG